MAGEGAWHRLAVDGAVQHGARGGEAERARAKPFLDDVGHGGDVVPGRVLVRRAALAHRIGADRAMRHLCADVERMWHGFQRIQIFREGLPAPAYALGKRRAGNVLHAFHQADQPFAPVGHGGREADAAIAEYRRGDAVPAGGREPRVPGRLAVIMGVDIDEAGDRKQAVRVDLAPARPRLAAGLGEAPAVDGDIAGEGRLAGAVNDARAANNRVVHGSEGPGV